jgi:ZIP family zinc transporter
MLGFAGGVMIAVTLLDLLPFAYACGSLLNTAAGFVSGIFLMKLVGRVAGGSRKPARSPASESASASASESAFASASESASASVSASESESAPSRYLKMGRMIAIGIALHDLPEGMSIAAGWSAHAPLGLITALAIGLHNIPEGVATAAPLLMGGKKRSQILLYCLWISLFTPLGAVLGLSVSQIGRSAVSVLLSLAAGSMTCLSLEELIPEALRASRIGGFGGFMLGTALTGWMIFVLTG